MNSSGHTIPVSAEQAERAARIMIADDVSYDTLVGLALDAYEAMAQLTPHVPDLNAWRETYRACVVGESHYCEVTA